ncbi:Mrp/NBP35 family ATP-binding protein [bacterium]|nr:Mrp/NBP35 family ATP-binding protein [bacterium]
MQTNPERQKQFEEQDRRIQENLKKIRHRIVVFSGKGGVGKTTVAVNLAFALMKADKKTGLLDADITGPNVLKMAGITGQPFMDGQNQILPMQKEGLQVISMAAMLPEDQPVIWRGPLRSGAISQFLADVIWGDLDYLLADLPPGTGDEVLTAAQRMRPQMAIVVTTPQEVSLLDCKRAVTMAKKLNVPNIGVIENMAGLICPHCEKTIDIFGKGGGERMAKEMDVRFLGKIPMELATREGGDTGEPPVLTRPESGSARAFLSIAEAIGKILK